MNESGFQSVLLIGAGMMGQQIGVQCAAHGFSVVLHDVSQPQLEAARTIVPRTAAQMQQERQLPEESVADTLSRIRYVSDPAEAAEEADLLIECIPEDMWLKRRVFRKFHDLCPNRTVFVSNSSTLIPQDVAPHCGRPSLFAALHFHPNVWDANVVDLMPGRQTAPEVMNRLEIFAREIEQQALVFDSEVRGFVINRLLTLLLRESQSLVSQGVVTPRQLDDAFRVVLKTESGPFEIMDRIGLDTILSINDFWCRRLLQIPHLDPTNRRNRKLLKSYVSRGRLGVKTGHGFYDYPDGDHCSDHSQPAPD